MEHRIEAAKTGRSACRECKQKIAKDEPRLGVAHPQENGYDVSYQWFHLDCAAASSRHLELEEALSDCPITLSDLSTLEAKIEATKKQQAAKTYPYAVDTDADAYLCVHCKGWSFPDTVRILVQRPIVRAGKTFERALPIHPDCANEYLDDTNLLDAVLKNSGPLDAASIEWMKETLT